MKAHDGMFDIDALLHVADIEAAPVWNGAPLTYHEEHRSPAELEAAFDRYIFENGSFGCIPNSHMWNRDGYSRQLHSHYPTDQMVNDGRNHSLHLFTAHASCDFRYGCKDHVHRENELPGSSMNQAICDECHWRSISSDYNTVIEDWHDHAFPGWRDLPHVPLALVRNNQPKRVHAWVEKHYPNDWQHPGYPIITEREQYATRHVEGRSPWAGYDLGFAVPEK